MILTQHLITPKAVNLKRDAVDAPMPLYNLFFRRVDLFVVTAGFIAFELGGTVVQIDMFVEIFVIENFTAACNIASELHVAEVSKNLAFFVLVFDELLLAIGARTVCVTLVPLVDACFAEHTSAFLATLGVSDHFSAHHADEAVVLRLSDHLFLFELWVAPVCEKRYLFVRRH